eukprot:478005-Amphidinium_carterae.2
MAASLTAGKIGCSESLPVLSTSLALALLDMPPYCETEGSVAHKSNATGKNDTMTSMRCTPGAGFKLQCSNKRMHVILHVKAAAILFPLRPTTHRCPACEADDICSSLMGELWRPNARP